MADGYQPLATYGAQTGRLVEEARFQPGVDDDDLIRAGRLGAQYIRPARGFHSLVYLYDGQRHRALTFWQDQDAIQRFHSGRRVELLEQETSSWPESPWITHLEGFRSGVAHRQLMGPRMHLEQTDLAVLSPPGAAFIFDISGVDDVDSVLDPWKELIPSTGFATIQQFRGFMFFSACDFGDGDLSVYLAFRTGEDRDAFSASELNAALQSRLNTAINDRHGEAEVHDGQFLCWTVRKVD